mmetsp:Transcript_75568/g.213791  ORF Transcript_75568/g.213791 Transcript_75568/m.213791 type:complete len:234 (+) Transcript_75568:2823-3524(+)
MKVGLGGVLMSRPRSTLPAQGCSASAALMPHPLGSRLSSSSTSAASKPSAPPSGASDSAAASPAMKLCSTVLATAMGTGKEAEADDRSCLSRTCCTTGWCARITWPTSPASWIARSTASAKASAVAFASTTTIPPVNPSAISARRGDMRLMSLLMMPIKTLVTSSLTAVGTASACKVAFCTYTLSPDQVTMPPPPPAEAAALGMNLSRGHANSSSARLRNCSRSTSDMRGAYL